MVGPESVGDGEVRAGIGERTAGAEPIGDAKFQSTNENQKLYYHRLGTAQIEDVLVYERPDHPKWSISGDVTEDGRYLVISIGDGTTSRRNRVAIKDLNEPYGLIAELVANHDNKFNLVGNDGPITDGVFPGGDDALPAARAVTPPLPRSASVHVVSLNLSRASS